MKNFITTALFVFFALSYCRAQYVPVNDTAFAQWLKSNGFAGCMNGNQLDTTCSTVVNDTVLSINYPVSNHKNINDITAIRYFDKLKRLTCQLTKINNLPQLPASLNYLVVSNNQLTVLPTLPSSLKVLDFQSNQIAALPVLPALTTFYCTSNKLTTLPVLPSTLVFFSCGANNLGVLPALPSTIKILACDNDNLTALPTLPPALTQLFCFSNKITSLPALPSSIVLLLCSQNNLASLPTLPSALVDLECSNNLLTSLPAMPLNVIDIDCSHNHLTSMGSLPFILQEFLANDNPDLLCLPFLIKFLGDSSLFSLAHTGITCLPNTINHNGFISAIDTLPLCANPTFGIPEKDICAGETATLKLTANYSSYKWSTGATTQSISGITSGSYSVTVSNTCGSGGIGSINVIQSPCGAPTGIAVNAIQNTTAHITWTVQDCAFNTQLHYRVTGTTTWSIIGVNAPTNTRTLTGLVAGTEYDLQLRTRCSATANIYSAWTTIQNFTTKGATCDAPATVTANNLKQTRATISWTAVPGAYSYKLHTRLKGTTPWTNRIILAPTNNKVLTGLTANTAYEYQVQTICDVSGTPSSVWTSVQSFTTTLRMEEESEVGDVGDFVLYPNPATDKLAVGLASGESSLGGAQIEITDLLGRIYLTQMLQTETTVTALDVSGLTAGVYFVTLHTLSGNTVRKFVKI